MIKRNNPQPQPVISSKIIKTDNEQLEISLRPKRLNEYIGQTEIKKNLNVFMQAAKIRKEPMEHILLYGAPGLGKTTLAGVIAQEMDVNIKITSGPALERQGDLASIITNLQENDILFIDEIHRLKPIVEEILYSAMEDYAIDIIIGKGPSAKTMRLPLPKFTLIGATTKISLLSSPLRDRFGSIFKLNFYQPEEIKAIIKRSAGILRCKIIESAAEKIAECSRNTPRVANRLLKRVRDFACIQDCHEINQELTEKALSSLGVDHLGLDHNDRNFLTTIIQKFTGGPVGLNTISAAIGEEEGTVEDVYEPYLIQSGLLERSSRGRLVTKKAYEHLEKHLNSKFHLMA